MSNSYRRGYTPLHIAILVGNKDLVQLLLQFEADINISCKEGTVQELAAKGGNKQILDIVNEAAKKGIHSSKIIRGNNGRQNQCCSDWKCESSQQYCLQAVYNEEGPSCNSSKQI